MSSHSQRQVTIVWIGLMLATCSTWWIGTHHPFASSAQYLASAIAIAIAFLKVYYVGMDFMELRKAPRPLRYFFIGWLLLIGSAAIGLYSF
jgi:apolipoprotein N-acyltransferase